MNSAKDRRIAAALAFASAAWLAWPLLDPRYVGWDGDSLFLFLPAMRLARDELLAGRVPLWNPYKFMGVPLLADLMVPAFYPPQLLALMAPQPWGQHALEVAHVALAAVGTFLLARRAMGCSPAGAALAGLTFALSATLTAAIAHPNQLCATAWLPWVWLAALGIERGSDRARQTLALGLALGLQMLAGQPQIVFFSGLLLGWTALARLTERGLSGRLTSLAIFAGGTAMALGLAAVHWLPARELASFSSRRAMDESYASTFALPWRNLVTLILPGWFGAPGTGGYRGEWNFTETAIFFGQTALALSAIGLAARRRERRVWLVAVVALTGLILALGRSTPVYDLLLRLAPPLANFRAPARAWCLTALGLAVAAGWGMDAAALWIERRRGRTARRWAVSGLFVLQMAGLGWFRFFLAPFPSTTLDALQTPGVAQTIRASGTRPGRIFRLVDEIDYNDASLAATRAKVAAMQPDLNALAGLRDVLGYDEGLLPTEQMVGFVRHFWRNLYTPTPDSRLLGLMGVEYLLADKPVFGDRWKRVARRDKFDLWRNLDYRGPVFTRADWPDIDLQRVLDWFPIADANRQPIDLARPAAPGTPSPIRADRVAPGQLRVHLPAEWSGELLLSEGWMPGWFAEAGELRIAGRPLNAVLIAFKLPPGHERWTLRYDPPSFRWGAGISLVALAAALGLLLRSLRYRRTSPDRPLQNVSENGMLASGTDRTDSGRERTG